MIKAILTTDKSKLEFIEVKAATLNETLRTQLAAGVAHFAFTKKDGSVREAFGTLKPDKITTPSGEGLKANPEVTGTYFDLEANAWRSYTIANLIAVY